MIYFVPAWHRQMSDWAYYHPQLILDDAINQIKTFQDKNQRVGLVITDYQPQLSVKLSEYAIAPQRLFSAFDYLQGIGHLSGQIIDYHDFQWPANARFDFTPFRILVDVHNRLYAKIIFETHGRILAVEYFNEHGDLSRRLLMDSRGFISREEQFKDNKPTDFIYFDELGYWRFKVMSV